MTCIRRRLLTLMAILLLSAHFDNPRGPGDLGVYQTLLVKVRRQPFVLRAYLMPGKVKS